MKKILFTLLIAAVASFAHSAQQGTIAANGDTDEQVIKGPFFFRASGTWGAGTFTVYYKSKDGTFKTLSTPTALTSDVTGQLLYDLPPEAVTRVKATLSGSTTPSLSWEFIGQKVGD